ncbi:hypothetical protein HJC23_007196 [Cyclotella cryptica]|uniref:Uncharacterized protein n=1 Tax=Cyclotella cryptica TaxID=29204 RepID=A0ABD3QS44_9STRA
MDETVDCDNADVGAVNEMPSADADDVDDIQKEKKSQPNFAIPPNGATGNPSPQNRNINSHFNPRVGIVQTLSLVFNTALLVYAHLSLSAVIFSSRDPSITSSANVVSDNTFHSNLTSSTEGKCTEEDIEVWSMRGGEVNRPIDSNFCSRTYNNGACLIDAGCIATCFEQTYGYSSACSSCFADIPTCSISSGCTFICAEDSLGSECQQCNIPCIAEFNICSGLPEVENSTLSQGRNETDAKLSLESASNLEQCNTYDLGAINTWYIAYNLSFVKSIHDAWTGGAKLLAVIVVVFSGIWPYTKSIVLVIVWYLPMSSNKQASILLWLARLSSYTLVDVFAVIVVLVGVQLQLNVGGTQAVIRAEPRFGIIAFLIATVWQLVQVEVVKGMFEKKMLDGIDTQAKEKLLFKQVGVPIIILAASCALFVAGTVMEVVYFKSIDTSGVCIVSYNIVSLGNALVNEHSMTSNEAPGQTWILYLAYILLNVAFPVITHLLQVIMMFGHHRGEKIKQVFQWTAAIWYFACVEVSLLGIFAVCFKYDNLIMKIAGDSNSGFLDIESGLGPGFYILIAYSVAAGFLLYSLRHIPEKKVSLNACCEEENESSQIIPA